MTDDTLDGALSFQVDASLLVQLGEQLVARRSIALAELIKNAYDADATVVRVVMQCVKTPDGSILVDDNGLGMTLEQVRSAWMRVATTAKSEEPVSPKYHRARAGSKGIGRFAARRLGSKLLLASTADYPDNVRRTIEVGFDWDRDFAPGTDIGATKLQYSLRNVSPDTPTGTALLIERLDRETWNERDVEDLQRDLLSLTPPFDVAEILSSSTTGISDPGFSVALEAAEFPELEGELKDHYLQAAWGVLTGRVDSDGIPHYKLIINEPDQCIEFSPDDVAYPAVGRVALSVHFMVYRAETFRGLAFGARDAQRYGGQYGGVRLYVDGFRVFPYGDTGDDWLRLDWFRARRLVSTQSLLGSRTSDILEWSVPNIRSDRSFLLTPGNNQLFGAIFASRAESPDIVANISREQVLENAAFHQLRQFAQLGIFWMTLQYARTTTSRRKQESKSHDQIPELLTQAKDLVADAPIRANLKEAMLTSLERVETATRAEREEHIGQIQMLRVLSATGAAVSIFNHQISAIGLSLSAIRSQLMELRHFVNANGRALHNELLQTTERAERLFAGQQSQLRALLGQRGRRRAVRINLYDAVAQVFDALRFYCEENQILLKNDVPDRLTSPPMYQSELYAVLLHLITNAVKAVSGTQERRISVRAMTDRGHLLLYILDTGVGLDPAKREEVFDYFVSYSTPHEILGPGTGLGLAVVRDIIREYNGTIQFIDALAPWRTCVEIRLPIRAGS